MDKRQRMALLGIAAVIAAVAVAVALATSGGDEDNTTTAADTTAQGGGGTQGGATGEAPTKTPEANPDVTEIRVKDGRPVGGVAEIEARKGDTVRIDVTSDVADELHLHVYDVEKPLEPGKTTQLRFKATIEGVIELELHEAEQQIAEITVEP